MNIHLLTVTQLVVFILFFGNFALATPQLQTKQGVVIGSQTENGEFFANIPFAEPPVGNLRWKAPRSPRVRTQAWDGSRLKIKCAQKGSYFSGIEDNSELGKTIGSEDCLYLNVWTPGARTKKRPVFVWFHGGGNRQGFASDPIYNGEHLSKITDAIVVTVNYRLGFFGALFHEALHTNDTIDSSGNFVTLDGIQALKWIHENIEELGGDTNRITIGGESAGCVNVWGLLQSPLAKGLFQQAYCSSGFPNSYPKSMAQKTANNLIKKALVMKTIAADSLQASAILGRMSREEIKKFLYSLTTQEILHITPSLTAVQHIADGNVLSELGLAVFSLGKFNAVPLMVSTNSMEGSLFFLQSYLRLSNEEFWKMTTGQTSSKPLTDFVESKHFSSFQKDSKEFTYALNQVNESILVHGQFHIPAIYRMRWDWAPSNEPWRSAFGASHGFELPLLFHQKNFANQHFFGFLNSSLDKESMQMSKRYLGYFKGFLHTGNPNSYQAGEQEWKKWKVYAPSNLVFSRLEIREKSFYFNPALGTYDLIKSILNIVGDRDEL